MGYRVGVDIGGTFTDFCAFDEATGALHTLKVLSTPQKPGEEVIQGVGELERRHGIDPRAISYFTHGTTVGVNTVIQRRGIKLCLFTTKGFEDVLEVARLKMPDPYDLFSRRPEPLVTRDRVFSIAERVLVDGTVDEPLDEASVEAAIDGIRAVGGEGVVVALLHAYRNPVHERRVAEILAELPCVQKTVVVSYVEEAPDLSVLPNAVSWDEASGGGQGREIDFAQVAFDHPLFIMYSSGTTGAPKCIVHGHGGTLLQHLKELALHADVKAGDRLFYFSTCGWMMWNWQVSGLACEATLMLYEGNPAHPGPQVLWDFAEKEKISIFGTSAKYISAIEKAGVKPRESHDLSRLRLLMSTGSPLAHESFDYVYRDVKADIQLSSISGGTDIISCFALGNPMLPVRKGELQSRGLGMAVDVFGDDGKALPVGEKGELVCTRPFPSMPVGFWNDPDGAKYHAAYFDTFPNVWRHGDWSMVTESGGMVIYGRSDAVLNPGGVRIGTAEIYRQVEQFDAILDSLCIGQDWEDDVRVVLFVVMRPGHDLTDELRGAIRQKIRANASPRHMPAKILAVADIPRTRSNKISELAVRDIVHGRGVKNTEALANPEALKLFENLEELQS